MTKAELEKKHLSELHLLAAEAGVEKYRLLSKSELVEKLAERNGNAAAEGTAAKRDERSEGGERPRRRRRSRRTGSPAVSEKIEEGEAPQRAETAKAPRQRRDRPQKA